jgi:hypothetical protein
MMKFFFDESGNFQLPPAEEHRVGIVSGVAIPDSDEAEVFQQFDAFLNKLPVSSFQNGEPKGRLLDDAGRKALAGMLVNLPGILVCPIMLDLTSLVGQPQSDAAGLVSRKLIQLQATCKHGTFRNQIAALANDIGALSTQQAFRLAAWAKCITRTVHDSIIYGTGIPLKASSRIWAAICMGLTLRPPVLLCSARRASCCLVASLIGTLGCRTQLASVGRPGRRPCPGSRRACMVSTIWASRAAPNAPPLV